MELKNWWVVPVLASLSKGPMGYDLTYEFGRGAFLCHSHHSRHLGNVQLYKAGPRAHRYKWRDMEPPISSRFFFTLVTP